MKRREFLSKTLPAILYPTLIGGFSIKAFANSPILSALAGTNVETDRVLVLVQLNGGNDGLNTVIPLDQYGNLFNARENIIIPESKILKLDGFDQTGLHPMMTGLQALFNDGKLGIIQSVGYPDPTFSHFRATDIWITGSGKDKILSSGWAGRYLTEEFPDYPVDYPNPTDPDPLAIQVGSVVSTCLQGLDVSMGMAIPDPTDFYNFVNGIQDPAPNTLAGKELSYIRLVSRQSQAYGTVIKAAAEKVTQQAPYPASNHLADQLKIVSRLIAGGLKTRIYMVNIGSFDTHSSQVDGSDKEKGRHAELLKDVSSAIKAFTDDLKFLGIEKRVLGMTFSEFGRRIKSNAGLGTDHGTAAPLFVFGEGANSGILGNNPTINSVTTINDNVPMQYDLRSVYSTLLQNWFCVSGSTSNNVLMGEFAQLPIIKDSYQCLATGIPPDDRVSDKTISNYPNPFNTSTTITFYTNGGNNLIQIFDLQGKLIKTVVDTTLPKGEHQVVLQNEGWPAGIYYARLRNGSVQQTRAMVIA